MNSGRSKVMVDSSGGKMIVNSGKWPCCLVVCFLDLWEERGVTPISSYLENCQFNHTRLESLKHLICFLFISRTPGFTRWITARIVTLSFQTQLFPEWAANPHRSKSMSDTLPVAQLSYSVYGQLVQANAIKCTTDKSGFINGVVMYMVTCCW